MRTEFQDLKAETNESRERVERELGGLQESQQALRTDLGNTQSVLIDQLREVRIDLENTQNALTDQLREVRTDLEESQQALKTDLGNSLG